MSYVVDFVHLSVSMSISVCCCVFPTCVCVCGFKCGSVPFHPPSVAIRLLTTEGKVKVLQTKRHNVLTRASSDKRSEERGLREAKGAEKVDPP